MSLESCLAPQSLTVTSSLFFLSRLQIIYKAPAPFGSNGNKPIRLLRERKKSRYSLYWEEVGGRDQKRKKAERLVWKMRLRFALSWALPSCPIT